MTAAQQESLVALLTRLCDHFAIPASRVYTHREILQGKTACPGPALSRFVSEIRDDLRRRTIALGK
jgi:N-acetyl-anhydromuramyl-L-alanine amidase AmpD